MGKVIVVASGKGGTGKTTTVGAISSCLAALGYKTLCIDCDAGLRNLDIIIGMSEYTVTDFGDVLEGIVPLGRGLFRTPENQKPVFPAGTRLSGPGGHQPRRHGDPHGADQGAV